ncbi:MAG TPA: hypothetical protein VKT33_02310 [Candidatus Angelobacter sp.]|nr:hypothetical protein [Candidatus Angelobacter sp.]
MPKTLGNILWVLLFIGIYGITPALLIWGWMRWARHAKPQTLLSRFSLTGFILATLSAVLALSTLVYAQATGGFRYWDPHLLWIYRIGTVLSLIGLISGVSGMWRTSPVRWHAPLCSLGMLVFWIMSAAGE